MQLNMSLINYSPFYDSRLYNVLLPDTTIVHQLCSMVKYLCKQIWESILRDLHVYVTKTFVSHY